MAYQQQQKIYSWGSLCYIGELGTDFFFYMHKLESPGSYLVHPPFIQSKLVWRGGRPSVKEKRNETKGCEVELENKMSLNKLCN